jgi:zeta-carotene desaturase
MRDVLIIGGGFAGLAAGVALSEAGHRVHLLEQKPYLGGRARSFREPQTGSVVDNGQHLIMGCYHSTLHFLKTIGTLDRIWFQPRLTIRFVNPDGRQTTLECPNLPSPWHVLVGVIRSRSFSARQKREVLRMGLALRKSGAEADPGPMTVSEWLSHLGQSKGLQQNFWDLLCIAALNEDPAIASAALFSHVLRLALFSSPEDSRLGFPQVGLSDCFTEAAAAFIRSKGGKVECDRSVRSLMVADGHCRGVRLTDGAEIEAHATVSAAPWIQFASLLPQDLLRSEPYFGRLLALRPAPILSVNLWFDRPICEIDFAALRGTTIQWLFNKTRILRSAENCVSLVLSGAHKYVAWSKEDLAGTAVRELKALFPAARDAKLEHSLVIKERFATFSPTCDAESLRPTCATPLEGLFLAGDWTATGLPATIEGAVRSGYAAAKEIIRRI